MSEFTATFWGVRGGRPVPGPGTAEFGGNTTCLEVRAGSHLIIIDAGTGIIRLGAKLVAQREQDQKPLSGTMLFTHGHHDHTQGFAFFAPLRLRDSVFRVYGPRVFGGDLEQVLRRAVLPAQHPIALDRLPGVRSIRNVQQGEVILLTAPDSAPVVKNPRDQEAYLPSWAAKIWVYHSSNHPRDGSFCYRIEYQGKRLVFATDTEGYQGGDRLLSQFVRGADLLIHDSEYVDHEYTGPPFSRQGWGHSTWRMAVEVGQLAGVKRLALTHHNAQHDDAFMRALEKEAQAVFPDAFVTREGMTVQL
jgi:phosphoribosyl 1,2-cyclic phosphodiesterase